ncbi:uncharacterized protein LOC126249495 [Schistocerca nitens]|uniref:uncharacterized protein LOC126249495 n=1 Tax=Schistocerca nitens TaxID=7011 RepID=UPI002117D3CC|nr:uncharacterized protein LOC126249495 [Schistocerca nitens]
MRQLLVPIGNLPHVSSGLPQRSTTQYGHFVAFVETLLVGERAVLVGSGQTAAPRALVSCAAGHAAPAGRPVQQQPRHSLQVPRSGQSPRRRRGCNRHASCPRSGRTVAGAVGTSLSVTRRSADRRQFARRSPCRDVDERKVDGNTVTADKGHAALNTWAMVNENSQGIKERHSHPLQNHQLAARSCFMRQVEQFISLT